MATIATDKYDNYIVNVSTVGILIALYSIYVKWRYTKDPTGYRALCDFNENMSCTRVLASK